MFKVIFPQAFLSVYLEMHLKVPMELCKLLVYIHPDNTDPPLNYYLKDQLKRYSEEFSLYIVMLGVYKGLNYCCLVLSLF